VRKISGAVIAVNDNNMPLSPADEIAAVHIMLDRHLVPRDHAGQALSLQGRVQEFAFMAAGGAVKLAQRGPRKAACSHVSCGRRLTARILWQRADGPLPAE
jgi:hypothetical protein